MPKKSGIIFVMMGAVLMLSALLLFLNNGYESRRAGQQSELLLSEIQAVMTEQTEHSTEPKATEETLPAEMPVQIIQGYGYIGYLAIPSIELELPVMAEWDYDRLQIAPCRHFGSTRTDDLVIAAHNYKSHFGQLEDLEPGTEILFTDMDGIVNYYTLIRQAILPPDAVDVVQNSEHDLVLYTCTPGGATRVTAFCDRVDQECTERGDMS